MEPGSDQWCAAVSTAELAADAVEVMVEYRVRGADERVWHLGWRDGSAVAAAGPADAPDVTLTFSADALSALADATLDLQQAVADGRLGIEGRAAALAEARATLEALARAATPPA